MRDGGSGPAGDRDNVDFVVVHAPDDVGWAEWIAWQIGRLTLPGADQAAKVLVRVWHEIPGSIWTAVVDRALQEGARVVPVVSATFVRASADDEVWQAAIATDPHGANRRVVPVLIDDGDLTGLLAGRSAIRLGGLDETEAVCVLTNGVEAAVRGPVRPSDPPPFPGTRKPAFPGNPTDQLDRSPNVTVTVMHLSHLRFSSGPRELCAGISAGTGTTVDERRSSPLFGRLHDDLAGLAATDGLRPDLVVVTGDLTETGAKREFDQVHDFLTTLVDALDLPHDRTAIVPGSRDVNRNLCRAYFLESEEDDEAPQPPYWPKWKYFDALLRRFYNADSTVGGIGADASVGFGVGQEWSLFRIPAVKVVVAGLNSTMAETHEVRHGWLGTRQLDAVGERLRQDETDGWLRIGAIHHDPQPGAGSLHDAADLDRVLGLRLNLLLHGETWDDGSASLPSGTPVLSPGPGQYQLLCIDRDGWVRHRRRYSPNDKRWEPDPETEIHQTRSRAPKRTSMRFVSVQATFPAPPPVNKTKNKAKETKDRGSFSSRRSRHDENDSTYYGDHADDWNPFRSDRRRERRKDELDEIADVARLRHLDGTIERVEAFGGVPAHLRVYRAEGQVFEQRVVGLLADSEVTEAAVEEFVQSVRRPYLARFPSLFSDLVYVGSKQAEPQLVDFAVRRGVTLVSMPEYQGVLDLRGYVSRQTTNLSLDLEYPPHLYVPQRIRRMDRRTRAIHENALGQIMDWLTTDDARFVLVLGGFGHGKTFLMHQLALGLREWLPHVDPLLIELRNLEKSPDLDRLVAQHLVDSGVRRPDLDAFRYMLRHGRVVLLFDGFDELVARVTYERAVAHLDTLLNALDGQAKIVVTSRAEFFLTDDEVLKKTGEKVEQTLGRFIVRLEDFTPNQINAFLVGHYASRLSRNLTDAHARQAEAERLAQARIELIRDVQDLPDLARNPKLLSFMAELDDRRLREVRDRQHGDGSGDSSVTAADLYRELIGQWLAYECKRSPVLSVAEREAAVTELAVAMWRAGETYIDVSALTEVAGRALRSMQDPRDLTAAETAHQLGSSTALRRDAVGRFSFIHQSVMEYLVANDAAARLERGADEPNLFGTRAMSELMTDFFADVYGRSMAAQWAQDTVDDPAATIIAKANAVLLATRAGVTLRTGAKLAGADLRGKDLSGRRDLRGADLRRAKLSDARLVGADLTGADLRDATLTGATIERSTLTRANLAGAILSGTTLASVDLAHVDLSGADLTDARLTEVDLTGAVTTGSRWARAAVLGGRLDVARCAEVLTEAAVAGRDPAEASVSSASSPVHTVVFSPDGSVMAAGSDDGSVRLWNPATGTEQRTLAGHTGAVWSVAFSPDGSLLATGSYDRQVRLWDPSTGTELRALTGHGGRLLSVAFSPDGSLLAAGSSDGQVRLWNPATGTELRALTGHGDRVLSVAFSPDGSLLATGSSYGQVRLWDPATGTELRALTGHGDRLWSVAFSPDGSLLATGSDDESVRLWEVATGRPIGIMIGTLGGWGVLLPNGAYKLGGDSDGAFKWTIKTVRFKPGELDPYDPVVRRLPEDAPLPLPAGWRLVTPRPAPPRRTVP